MSDKSLEDEFSQWFSTYGVITSQRILERYQIVLSPKSLLAAIKTPVSFYHQLILVPLKHVLNGIVLQQANDYHVYAQKLFIDYLLSGESSKDPESQGALTREDIEVERKELVTIGEQFAQKQLDHDNLIASTQGVFIKLTGEFKNCFDASVGSIDKILILSGINVSKKAINAGLVHALIFCGVKETMNVNDKNAFIVKMNEQMNITMTVELKGQLIEQLAVIFDKISAIYEQIEYFSVKVREMSNDARSYRTQFYNKALRAVDLLSMLSEYRINPEQDAINREALHFDKSIGEL